MKLNIGCGRKILKGYVNCDYVFGFGVDKVFDITKGIPYPDESVDEIIVEGVFGHILNWHHTPMLEIYRVLKPGGIVKISEVRGFSHDPYHVRYFFEDTLSLFYVEWNRFGCEDFPYRFDLVSLKVESFMKKLQGKARHIEWILKKPVVRNVVSKEVHELKYFGLNNHAGQG